MPFNFVFRQSAIIGIVGLFCVLCSQAQTAGGQVQVTENAQQGRWEVNVFGAGGFSPDHIVHGAFRFGEALDIYDAGIGFGRVVTAVHGGGWLRGDGEFLAELMPFWYAEIPRQRITVYTSQSISGGTSEIGPFGYHGVAVTPLLFRWNTLRLHRVRPYGELGGGLLWTAENFPPGLTTSNINFTPQVEFGAQIPTRSRQSVVVGARVVHISSAGLGLYNPGVNVNVQLHVGYTWWKR